MIIFLLLLVVCIIGLIMWKHKVNIDVRSFLAKSLYLDRDVFGVYCFTGHQGSGKTYSLVKWLKKHHDGKKIYSNIHIDGIKYYPIRDLKHLYSLADERKVIIIYDEIFTIMSKSKRDREILEQFLPQMRKVKNIFMTTAQYWLELDVTFRRFVRVQIECSTIVVPVIDRGILIEHYRDATKMQWDNMQNEYVCPTISTKISKYERRFMKAYDTYETIKSLKQ